MIIVPGTSEFLYPQRRNGIIVLNYNEEIELFCSSRFVAPFNYTQFLIVKCTNDNLFKAEGKTVPFSSFACTSYVPHLARRSNETCFNSSAIFEFGFQIADGRFLPMMKMCHNEVQESTLWTQYPQIPANAGFQRTFQRPRFTSGPMFGGRNVDRLYIGVIQRQTIGGLIGPSRVEQLWNDEKNLFLARGHLAARADFIYASQQRATFYIANVAPQWHSFNVGNWLALEISLRGYVADNNINTEIYTGTFGVQQLRDENRVLREIFLDFDRNRNGLIPAPVLYYKVVIEPISQRGIVFIGVNNPHTTIEEIRSKYIICRDVSSLVTYINWKRNDLTQGFSYACEVEDFVQAIGYQLPANVKAVNGLLL